MRELGRCWRVMQLAVLAAWSWVGATSGAEVLHTQHPPIATGANDHPRGPLWTVDELPWLRVLEDSRVVEELQSIVDADVGGFSDNFAADFGPNSDLADRLDGWSAVVLMNKGVLDAEGCVGAPRTCLVLDMLAGQLAPRASVRQVGVRLLKLDPGVTLRTHVGPGGRLVAHLGIRVPPEAFMTLAGSQVHWREGALTVFDDSFPHSVANPSAIRARYILHVAFPRPTMAPLVPLVSEAGPDPPVSSVSTPRFRLEVYANCSAVVTNLRTKASSKTSSLLELYNRPSDNRLSDWSPCVSATRLGTSTPNQTQLRIAAMYGYGTIDIGVTSREIGAGWVKFTVLNDSSWSADPVQRHIQFATLCPDDMCPSGYYPSGGAPTAAGQTVDGGKFQGFRGLEDSSGWFTITSEWQFWNTMLFAKAGDSVAYSIAPTSALPALWGDIGKVEHIEPLNPNRALSWFWAHGANESNLGYYINITKAVGADVLFIGDYNAMLSNIGDYQLDTTKWPSGFESAKLRVKESGLQIGLHMISSGSTVCLDQMENGWSPYGRCTDDTSLPYYCSISCGRCLHGCKGNRVSQAPGDSGGTANIDTDASRHLSHLMVPQGPTPMNFYYANNAGAWDCHEMVGDVCAQKGAGAGCASTPMIGCPNATNITLHNTSWSTIGRYRTGGAILFDGVHSYAELRYEPCGGVRACGNCHIGADGKCTEDMSFLNFSYNHFYPNISSEFTFQAVIHPLATSTGDSKSSWPQVIMSKPNEWLLQIASNGTLEWHVRLASGWAVAYGSTDVRKSSYSSPNQTYVVKATHAAGTIKLFLCTVGPNFECSMPVPEGVAKGTLPLATGTADVLFGAASKGSPVLHGFVGALEEIQFNRISYENISAHLFTEPGSGCSNYYIWDYTNPAARAHWAQSIAQVYNSLGPAVSQWDGAEFQLALHPWGIAHSNYTRSSLESIYWVRATMAAFMESRRQWQQPVAVEFSFSDGGLGPWHGDMTPFGDEGRIVGPSGSLASLCSPEAEAWHHGMLNDVMLSGTTYNAYSTQIERLANRTGVDCWLGRLIATGVAPQVTSYSNCSTVVCLELVPDVRYWLDKSREVGKATESSIVQLQSKPIFFISLVGGTAPNPHFAVYFGDSTTVALPPIPDNSSLVLAHSLATKISQLDVPSHSATGDEIITMELFAASNITSVLSGGFWIVPPHGNVREEIWSAESNVRLDHLVFGSNVSGGVMSHTVNLGVRERARYTVVRPSSKRRGG